MQIKLEAKPNMSARDMDRMMRPIVEIILMRYASQLPDCVSQRIRAEHLVESIRLFHRANNLRCPAPDKNARTVQERREREFLELWLKVNEVYGEIDRFQQRGYLETGLEYGQYGSRLPELPHLHFDSQPLESGTDVPEKDHPL